MKFIQKQPFFRLMLTFQTSTEVFFGTVCLIAVRLSDSVRTGCRRCGRVENCLFFGKTSTHWNCDF